MVASLRCWCMAGCPWLGDWDSVIRLSALLVSELALAHSRALNKSRLLSSWVGVDGDAGLAAPPVTPPGGAEP